MDVSERKEAEEERQANLWFLESMDRVNRDIQGTNDLERMVSDVLETVLSIFHCDRAWLVYPCDPEAASWRAVMEHTRPEWPGAFALGLDLPVDQPVARVFQAGRASSGPVRFGPGSEHPVPGQLVERFGVQSLIAVAVYPKVDKPYMFGLHQCTYQRVWTPREERLFQEIGRRLADALTTLLMFRNLRESEARLEEAERIAHVGYWDHNLDTDRLTWSNETYRIFGLPPQECPITFARYQELIHAEDREKMFRAVMEALRGGPRYEVEYRVVRSDGEVRIVHSTGDVTRDESGQPRRMFGALQDITERKRVEEELRLRGEELDRVMAAVPDYLWSGATDSEGRWTYRYYSPVVLKILGRPAEFFLADPERWLSTVHPEDRPALRQVFEGLRTGRFEHWEGEYRVVRPDGAVRWVRDSASATPAHGGLRVDGVVSDITDRKRAEEELRLRSEELDRVMASVSDYLWSAATDSEGRWTYRYYSPVVLKITGRPPEFYLAGPERWLSTVHPEDQPVLRQVFERLRTGQLAHWEGEYRVVRPDGTTRWVRDSASATLGTAGGLRIDGVVSDITDRKRAEAALSQAQMELAHVNRVTTMGQLAASIAHEVNQPIGAIVLNSQSAARWLGAQPPDLEEARQALGRITRDGNRAGEVINRLRALIKKVPPRNDPLDINETILEVIALTRSEVLRNGVLLQIELAEGLPLIRGDRIQLEQVMLNLIVNAVEAMSGMSEGSRELLISAGADTSNGALVSIRDTGPGLAPETAEHLFNAFYTTKPGGMGMGLSICRSIIEAHGGRLWATANVPQGAVFQFTLPSHRETAA